MRCQRYSGSAERFLYLQYLFMGCAQSSLEGKAASALIKPKLSLPLDLVEFLPQTGPLSRADYHKRLYSTDGSQEIAFQSAGLSLKYAFVSQRG